MTPEQMHELIKRTVEAAEKASGHKVLNLVLKLPDKTLLVIDAKRHVTVLNPPVELPEIKESSCTNFGLSENPAESQFPKGGDVPANISMDFNEKSPETIYSRSTGIFEREIVSRGIEKLAINPDTIERYNEQLEKYLNDVSRDEVRQWNKQPFPKVNFDDLPKDNFE